MAFFNALSSQWDFFHCLQRTLSQIFIEQRPNLCAVINWQCSLSQYNGTIKVASDYIWLKMLSTPSQYAESQATDISFLLHLSFVYQRNSQYYFTTCCKTTILPQACSACLSHLSLLSLQT